MVSLGEYWADGRAEHVNYRVFCSFSGKLSCCFSIKQSRIFCGETS